EQPIGRSLLAEHVRGTTLESNSRRLVEVVVSRCRRNLAFTRQVDGLLEVAFLERVPSQLGGGSRNRGDVIGLASLSETLGLIPSSFREIPAREVGVTEVAQDLVGHLPLADPLVDAQRPVAVADRLLEVPGRTGGD